MRKIPGYPFYMGMAILSIALIVFLIRSLSQAFFSQKDKLVTDQYITWRLPDSSNLPNSAESNEIRYGKDLIANTSRYFGPKGTVSMISNGMNCQNCHLEGGTRLFGNNYAAVFSTYPKFRDRSGTVETIFKRVNDCMERSLAANTTLDTNSREMQAIYSYLRWLGQYVPKGTRPEGTGLAELKYLKRAADPVKGRLVFQLNCQRCHGSNGEGQWRPDSTGYVYPPLWGDHSYSTAAGLFRLSRFAGYVRLNMPFDAPEKAERLTDEEAWDVAAYVNSQPRPERTFKEDWPDISKKPVDYPFGPYADEFPEEQHKYGPFKPIIKTAKSGKER